MPSGKVNISAQLFLPIKYFIKFKIYFKTDIFLSPALWITIWLQYLIHTLNVSIWIKQLVSFALHYYLTGAFSLCLKNLGLLEYKMDTFKMKTYT